MSTKTIRRQWRVQKLQQPTNCSGRHMLPAAGGTSCPANVVHHSFNRFPPLRWLDRSDSLHVDPVLLYGSDAYAGSTRVFVFLFLERIDNEFKKFNRHSTALAERSVGRSCSILLNASLERYQQVCDSPNSAKVKRVARAISTR